MESNENSHLDGIAQGAGALEELAGFGVGGGIELRKRAMIAAAVVGSFRAKVWFAELVAAERPVDQEAERRAVRPLAGG